MGGQQVRPLTGYPIRPLQPPPSGSGQRLDPSSIALAWADPSSVQILHRAGNGPETVPLRRVPLNPV